MKTIYSRVYKNKYTFAKAQIDIIFESDFIFFRIGWFKKIRRQYDGGTYAQNLIFFIFFVTYSGVPSKYTGICTELETVCSAEMSVIFTKLCIMVRGILTDESIINK